MAAAAAELVDAAGAAVVQLDRGVHAARAFLELYGYGGKEPRKQVEPATQTPAPAHTEPPHIPLPDPHPAITPTTPHSPSLPTSFALPSPPPLLSLLRPSTPPNRNSATTTSSPDSPLASLADFGLSALSLDLLEGNTPRSEERPVVASRITRASLTSPTVPVPISRTASATAPPQPTHPRRPDPNSMFNALLPAIGNDEYARLPPDLAAGMSRDYLNDMVNEINEALTGRQPNPPEPS
ncbi:hypothetical protein DFJ77DRAFT_477118 [Powellomyces hirtus]|nr:hypothetical protein DFJ77DRAFT_477118 [Powellomyces hirtus]